MPVTDIKLLRDQLAQVIGENKRQAARLKDNETKNVELTLTVDRIILEMSLIKQERDETLAKVERLENALREVAGGKIKAERILEYYDNAHTPPSGRTITSARNQPTKERGTKKEEPHGAEGTPQGLPQHRGQQEGDQDHPAPARQVRRMREPEPRGRPHRQQDRPGHPRHTTGGGGQPPGRYLPVP